MYVRHYSSKLLKEVIPEVIDPLRNSYTRKGSILTIIFLLREK